MRTIREAVKFNQSLVPAVRTASGNGTGVDTLGFNAACVVVNAGTIDTSDGNETYAVTVEESADNSTGWAAVSGISIAITASSQIKSAEIPGVGTTRKRYLRAVLTAGGTTPSIAGGAIIAVGNAYSKPVTQP